MVRNSNTDINVACMYVYMPYATHTLCSGSLRAVESQYQSLFLDFDFYIPALIRNQHFSERPSSRAIAEECKVNKENPLL